MWELFPGIPEAEYRARVPEPIDLKTLAQAVKKQGAPWAVAPGAVLTRALCFALPSKWAGCRGGG